MKRSLSFALTMLMAVGSAGAAPLSLSDAIRAALRNSMALEARSAAVESAAALERETWSHAFPKIALTASGTYMTHPQEEILLEAGSFGDLTFEFPPIEFPPMTGLPPIILPPTTLSLPSQDVGLIEGADPTYFQVNLALDQVIWSWGKIERSIRVAKLEKEVAQVAAADTRRDLERDVGRAYFAAWAGSNAHRILTEAETLASETVRDRERGLEEGTLVQLDVLEARSRLASLRTELIRARETLETTLTALEYLTGSRPEPADLSTRPRVVAPEMDEIVLASCARDTSGSLKTLEIRSIQARYAKDIRRASLMGLPDLSLKINLEVTGSAVPGTKDWLDSWDTNLMVTIAGRVSVFDSLSSIFALQGASADMRGAAAAAEELRRGIIVSVRRLVEQVRLSASSVEQRKAEHAVAVERVRSAEVGFRNELVMREETQQARVAALASELALVWAVLDAEYAILALEHAAGTSFPRPEP